LGVEKTWVNMKNLGVIDHKNKNVHNEGIRFSLSLRAPLGSEAISPGWLEIVSSLRLWQ
jgi:hypothetical protein